MNCFSNLFSLSFYFFFGLAEEFCKGKYCFYHKGFSEEVIPCDQGTWLVEFPNKKTWDIFKTFEIYSDIRLSLKVDNDTNFKWISGKKTSLLSLINENNDNYFVCLQNNNFYSKRFYDMNYFFCQGCSDINNPLCFDVPNTNIKSWYGAMNYCLERNKRLAVFEDDQVPKQLSDRLDSSKCYWIGLSRIRLIWPHYNLTMLFSKWNFDRSPKFSIENCFFVRDFRYWEILKCNSSSDTFCMKENLNFSTPNPPDFETKDYDQQTDTMTKVISMGIGFGLVLLLLIIIIIVLVYIFCRKNKNSKKDPKSSDNFEENNYEYTISNYSKSCENKYMRKAEERRQKVKTMFPNQFYENQI